VPSGFGLIPALPPVLIGLPHPGSEPLNVAAPLTRPSINNDHPAEPPRPLAANSFSERWSALPARQSNSALGFASDVYSPNPLARMNLWPIQNANAH